MSFIHTVVDGRALRWVLPYRTMIEIHAKKRWFGAALSSVIASEFSRNGMAPDNVLLTRPHSGKRNAGSSTLSDLSLLVQPHDILTISRSLFEFPIPDIQHATSTSTSTSTSPTLNTPGLGIRVLAQDEHVVVVDKPNNVPVHPTGRYMHNSVSSALEGTGGGKLYTVHRLDSPTSGILVFAKTAQAANLIQTALRNRVGLEKTYLAQLQRPIGEDVPDEFVIDDPIADPVWGGEGTGTSFVRTIGTLEEGARPASTRVVVLDRERAIVEAHPITGRTHQLRVHLAHALSPIVGDFLYSHSHSEPLPDADGEDTSHRDAHVDQILAAARSQAEDGVLDPDLAAVVENLAHDVPLRLFRPSILHLHASRLIFSPELSSSLLSLSPSGPSSGLVSPGSPGSPGSSGSSGSSGSEQVESGLADFCDAHSRLVFESVPHWLP